MISETDPYATDNTLALTRLIFEYYEHQGLIIGVDFDDTLYDYHNRGFTFPRTISILRKAQELNCKLCVWSATDDRARVESVWKEHGLNIDYYNESPVVLSKAQVKPYFNILLDDRAGLVSAVETLYQVLKYIEKSKDT